MSLDWRGELSTTFNVVERRIQRIGWVVIALILVAAIAGLFGGGLFSQATTRDAGEGYTASLSYPRFGRSESNLQLDLEVDAPGQSASQLTMDLSGEFIDKVAITGIDPEPESEAALGDSIIYAWDVEDWSRPVVIRFEYQARDWRTLGAELELRAGETPLGQLSFTQFLFP